MNAMDLVLTGVLKKILFSVVEVILINSELYLPQLHSLNIV